MYELQTDEKREPKSLFDVDINEDDDVQIDGVRPPKSIFDTGLEQAECELQTLGSCGQPETEKRKGFWRRQFRVEPTRRQRQYDWFFGVVMPAVCIFFDPIVFKFWGEPDGGILGAYRPFAYAGSFVSIILMITWLLWREKLSGFSALLAGVFFAASAISLIIGVVLLPFSLIGIVFYLIGLLGFTPLFTSVIFLRNGVRALRAANIGLERRTLVYASSLSALWGLSFPF